MGAIPLGEIAVYHHEFPSGLARPDFIEIIRLIDAEYLKTTNPAPPAQPTNHA